MSWRQIPCFLEQHPGSPEGDYYLGDNSRVDLSAYMGQVQCVYLDPPFLTGEDYSFRMRVGEKGWAEGSPQLTLPAYSDRFEDKEAYLAMLRSALTTAKELLKDSGALFLHLDSRMGAYARLLCDEIFGERNFVNEIIWAYQSGGRSMKRFSRKHDVILFYQKSRALYFDIRAVPVSRTENRQNHMRRQVDEQGRVYRTIRSAGKVYTYYDDEPAYPGDVWADVSHLQQKDPQRTGYDTQKPQALLERIIKSTTRPGDLVADLFAGSGTTLVAAAANGRRYLGVDMSIHALSVSRKRLLDTGLRLHAPALCPGASMEGEVEPGIGFYDIRLTGYAAPGMPDTIQGLSGVDQWSVGFVSGDVFTAQASAARRKQTPALPLILQLPQLRGTPAVMIVDVLGNRSLWVQE